MYFWFGVFMFSHNKPINMSSNVKRWKRTNKRVMSLLNSSFQESTLNTDIDGDGHITVEVNSLNDSFVSTNVFMLPSSK